MDKIQKKLDSLNSKTRNQEVDYPSNTKTRNMMGDIGRRVGSEYRDSAISKLQVMYDNIMKKNGVSLDYVKKLFNKDNYVIDPDKEEDYKFLKAHFEANESLWKKFKNKGGFFMGLDGKWKFWFSDDESSLKIKLPNLRKMAKQKKNSKLKLGDLLEHRLLFKYYPELQDMDVEITDEISFNEDFGGALAALDPRGKMRILISKDAILMKNDPMTGNTIKDSDIT